ncbi:transmembrane protein 180-like [Liolophura sinensis]|uniref:transmembrane protein 180-like n=1 Tax=Liolophura sinensis TaxID=3198878 RepID=UPI0031598386
MASVLRFNSFKISRPVLAFTALSSGLTMVHSVFHFYYVKIFLERYHISTTWFQIAQFLYLVWNTINDPLFAYLQDSARFRFLKTRRGAILYAAPFFTLAFLIPWFPWEEEGKGSWVTGLHLIVALSLYDTGFTFIGLAGCCLFTEISSQHSDRLGLAWMSSVGNIVGSSIGVYSCEFSSKSLQNFSNFQVTCVCIALCSWLLMTYTGLNAHTEFDKAVEKSDDVSFDNHQSSSRVTGFTMCQLTKHVLTNKNFVCFVIVNFCQEFQKTWISNFSVIVTENLIPATTISPYTRGIFHGLLNTFPAIIVIFGVSVVRYVGSHRVIMWNFYLKIFIGLFLYVSHGGFGNPWILMICMLIEIGYTGAAYNLFTMSLSDIADEDMQKHNRKHPISSMIYGTNALIVKPANSLSPMVVTAILNWYGYSDLRENSEDRSSWTGYTQLQEAMLAILCFMPVVVGVIQMAAWSRYTLRNTHKSAELEIIKS